MNSFQIPNKIWFSIVSVVLFATITSGQDTTWIQGFNFDSQTRDSLIAFPNGDHNQYEKVLMYYTMRCKDGLVSTSTERNKGCGEWDYSCNTNVIDSTSVDSLKAIHPNYIIQGLKENYFLYTTKPTYTYYSFNQDNVKINGSSNVTYYPVNVGSQNSIADSSQVLSYKAYFFIKASEISGLTQGNIAGISLNALGTGTLHFFKLKFSSTSADSITINDVRNLSFQEVYNRDLSIINTGKNDLVFHEPFNWNGSENIVIELSYEASRDAVGNLAFEIGYDSGKIKTIENLERDSYLSFNGLSTLSIPTKSMSDIKNEITVSFWSKGNAEILPADNSVFHAQDSSNNRQLNVHLPWSNGRIYWDCGNDGTGYDRIDKAAIALEYEGKWNHWAFTKNTLMGTMKIYLNGTLWHSGVGKSKKINIDKFTIGSDNNFNLNYSGDIDDFAVWDKELNAADIKSIMYQSPASISSLSDNLVSYYDFNEGREQLIQNIDGDTAYIVGDPAWRYFRGADVFKAFTYEEVRPKFSFIKGNYNLQVTNANVIDSIQNAPVKIRPFSVVGTDLVEGPALYYWASGRFPVYDEMGNVIDEVEFEEEDGLSIEDLVYYRKFPTSFELLSFVTPYGIGLDFGINGKTWIFDVTDYAPILKNKKRLVMDKGGQWQEDIDIKFAFVKGIPSRNVLSVQQVWPATSYGYNSILDNNALEPKFYNIEPMVKSMKVRTVTTGHGQEGEFIPRTHSLNINGGPVDFSWQVWKECANNPVYPQGGTWVYDRAGWCPGAPSDLREFEIMQYVGLDGKISIDYGLNTAEGDSRYIVNTQLVKYGASNFTTDAAIQDIVSPSTAQLYSRVNPACSQPKVTIKNNGSAPLKTVNISYGVEGKSLKKYTWIGNLTFLSTAEVSLPNLPLSDMMQGGKFIVKIDEANGTADQYAANNTMTSGFAPVRYLEGDIIVFMKTNGASEETRWTLKDENGVVIKTSKPNLLPNKLYTDTIRALVGCYQLQFFDIDDDGISWWANGDGNGSIGIKSSNTNLINLQPDFGKELTFNFTTDIINGTEDISAGKEIKIFPNPTNRNITINMQGLENTSEIQLLNNVGEVLYNEKIDKTNPLMHTIEIDMSVFGSGIYFVYIKNKGKVDVLKLVKI